MADADRVFGLSLGCQAKLKYHISQALAQVEREAYEKAAKECEAIVNDELKDLNDADFGSGLERERTNIRAWLMNARARIRVLKKMG